MLTVLASYVDLGHHWNIVLALVMLAGVGAWKYADKRESEAKAQELRGR